MLLFRTLKFDQCVGLPSTCRWIIYLPCFTISTQRKSNSRILFSFNIQ